jgi:PIN domain nuclease of toxin-antitoxin system
VKLLLDTHILLWATCEPENLPRAARAAVEEPGNVRLISAASAWEIATKHALRKLTLRESAEALLRRAVVDLCAIELPITVQHALASASLPKHHADPFDRLLVAQAITEGALLLTADARLPCYEEAGLGVLWAGSS